MVDWVRCLVYVLFHMGFTMRSFTILHQFHKNSSHFQMRSNKMTRVGPSSFINFCCRELGIGIVAYSPLGRGFFAGFTPDDNREQDGRRVTLKTLPSVCVMCASNYGKRAGRSNHFGTRRPYMVGNSLIRHNRSVLVVTGSMTWAELTPNWLSGLETAQEFGSMINLQKQRQHWHI